MGFPEELAHLVEQLRLRLPDVHGEAATKTSLVAPFLQVLGYDIFNPREVEPEHVADPSQRKGGQPEKIDYAVRVGNDFALFVECKAVEVTDLDRHDGQLAHYFDASQAVRIGVLTNGLRYRVFTDLQKPGSMDPVPWLDVDLCALKADDVAALQMLCKSDFNLPRIVGRAEELAFHNAIVRLIAAQIHEPGDSFIRWIAHEIHTTGSVTQKFIERLTPIVRQALKDAIGDHVSIALSKMDPADEKPLIARRKPAPRPADTIPGGA